MAAVYIYRKIIANASQQTTKFPNQTYMFIPVSNNKDPFGVLLSEIFFNGSRKIDGNKFIEKLLELDRSGKLCEEERNFWIPPEFRCNH